MPCFHFKFGDALTRVHVRGGRQPKTCFYCGESSEFECDYPVRKYKNGRWKTCDIALCFTCTQPGVSGNTDFCKEHFELAKAAYERRTAKEN